MYRLKRNSNKKEIKDFDFAEEEQPEDQTDINDIENLHRDDDNFLNDDFGSDNGFGDMDTMEKHSQLLRELTNFDSYIREMFNGWLAISWDDVEKKYVQNKNIDPVMNVKCASWCVSFLRTYTRKNNIITTISEKHYNFMISDIIMVLWLNIGLYADEYGIKSNGNILRICNELQHAAELVLMGAGGGKYNDLLKDTTKHSEGGIPNPYGYNPAQNQKIGMLQKAKNFVFGTKI